MIRDQYNIIPVTMAAIVHAVVVASLVFAFDFSSRSHPLVILPIQASLVSAEDIPDPPPVEMPEPEPDPEPEPEPDTSEQDRLREEEAKRQVDMKAEQERIRLQQERDRQRREREESERKERAEAEVERQRQLAERQRREDLERQRQENARLRREAEEAEMQRRQQQEIDAEARRLEAMQADDTSRWIFALQGQISRNFVPPASTPSDLECIVDVRQLPGGVVTNVEVGRCNGDEAVRRAIEAAVYKASPLPPPDNPAIFNRDLRITFKPEQ